MTEPPHPHDRPRPPRRRGIEGCAHLRHVRRARRAHRARLLHRRRGGRSAEPARCASPGSRSTGSSPSRRRRCSPQLRPDELARSAEIIGFSRVAMLGYRDSGHARHARRTPHPDSFHMAPLDEAVGRLVALIREERPQVILTYGDDQRGYPHPDHLKVHDISVVAGSAPETRRGTRTPASRGSRRSCTTRCGRGRACSPCTRG